MYNSLFFPKLTRREEKFYHTNRDGFYADYRKNYTKIAEDCLNRCVYCDITVDEFGGDEFQLDHFRPREHFEALETHPLNLHLACPKCNGLKTSDWPCSKKIGEPSYIGGVGYIDPFSHHLPDYLRVDLDGRIVAMAGPISYMIRKMLLNRPSRINVRRRRMIEFRKTRLLQGIRSLTIRLNTAAAEGTLSDAEFRGSRLKIDKMLELFSSIR